MQVEIVWVKKVHSSPEEVFMNQEFQMVEVGTEMLPQMVMEMVEVVMETVEVVMKMVEVVTEMVEVVMELKGICILPLTMEMMGLQSE